MLPIEVLLGRQSEVLTKALLVSLSSLISKSLMRVSKCVFKASFENPFAFSRLGFRIFLPFIIVIQILYFLFNTEECF